MSAHLNPLKVDVVLATVTGGFHLCWTILVALGWAQLGAGSNREMIMVGKCRYFSAALTMVVSLFLSEVQAQTRVPAIVTVCAPCHFPSGTGADIEKPNLAGQHSIYLRQQLLAFRSGKRRHPEMSKQARDLTDREIDQLVVYYSTLLPR